MLEQLWRSFQDGGWAMWAIFGFGLTGVGAAGRFAWRGEHQLVAFIRWMAVTVMGCGGFGYLIGTQRMLSVVLYRMGDLPWEKRGLVLLEGTREALTCLSGALMFVVIICILGAIGHRRFPWPNPASVPR